MVQTSQFLSFEIKLSRAQLTQKLRNCMLNCIFQHQDVPFWRSLCLRTSKVDLLERGVVLQRIGNRDFNEPTKPQFPLGTAKRMTQFFDRLGWILPLSRLSSFHGVSAEVGLWMYYYYGLWIGYPCLTQAESPNRKTNINPNRTGDKRACVSSNTWNPKDPGPAEHPQIRMAPKFWIRASLIDLG